MLLISFSREGWEQWGLDYEPLIPERMPVLIDTEIAELKAFRQRTLSQIAAQDAELQRLRRQLESGVVRRLPTPGQVPYGPCS
jgi:hypothetical protein